MDVIDKLKIWQYNFNLITIEKIHKHVKEKIEQNPSNNNFKYYSTKYQNNLSDKLAKILINSNNFKVVFKTNLIKLINYRFQKFH